MKRVGLFIIIFLISITSFAQQQKRWLDINYADDGNVYHNMDIHLPKTDAPSHKAIIIIYGSAWFANNMKAMAYQNMGQPLLDSGFAVISINHRSSSDAAYPAQIHDVKAAIRFVRANAEKYNIDPSFIGITGFSSGGHLAALAGVTNKTEEYTIGDTTLNIEGEVGEFTSTSSSVDAVVDWFGPADLAHMANGCTAPKGPNSPEAAIIKGDPAEKPDLIALLSPVTFVSHDDPPFLVIHGDSDEVVPHCQSKLFASALKKEGLLADFITVPNGQHGLVTFNKNTFNRMTEFFWDKAE